MADQNKTFKKKLEDQPIYNQGLSKREEVGTTENKKKQGQIYENL